MDDITHYGRPQGRGLKLHFGCGDYWKDGFINLDHQVLGGTDMIWDLRTKLPFQDKVVEMIWSGDFVEHFTRGEIDEMLKDWYRVLINGGEVYAIVPDIEELMRLELVQQIYGIEQDHKWGYTMQTFRELFESHGFTVIELNKREFSHRLGEPKLEILCRKEEK